MSADGDPVPDKPVVLIAAEGHRAAALAGHLREHSLDARIVSQTLTAMREVQAGQYDVVVVDLALRASFLLLDAIQRMKPALRPVVIVLRHTHADHAVLDPEVVTVVFPATIDFEMCAIVITRLAEYRKGVHETVTPRSGSAPDDEATDQTE